MEDLRQVEEEEECRRQPKLTVTLGYWRRFFLVLVRLVVALLGFANPIVDVREVGSSLDLDGDDDLFVNEVCNANNTAVCVHPEAFVSTISKTSFGKWYSQKKRHNFAGKYYKKRHQLKLAFFAFTHALLWLSFAANMFIYESIGWALILLGIYWIIKWPIIYLGFKKLKQSAISIWMPVFDILYVFYNSCFAFVSVFGKQKKW